MEQTNVEVFRDTEKTSVLVNSDLQELSKKISGLFKNQYATPQMVTENEDGSVGMLIFAMSDPITGEKYDKSIRITLEMA